MYIYGKEELLASARRFVIAVERCELSRWVAMILVQSRRGLGKADAQDQA